MGDVIFPWYCSVCEARFCETESVKEHCGAPIQWICKGCGSHIKAGGRLHVVSAHKYESDLHSNVICV
jgi:ribosomal protein L37AE/L43A